MHAEIILNCMQDGTILDDETIKVYAKQQLEPVGMTRHKLVNNLIDFNNEKDLTFDGLIKNKNSLALGKKNFGNKSLKQ